MAQAKIKKDTKVESVASGNDVKTVAERRNFYNTEEKRRQLFEATQQAIKLTDLTKQETRTFSTFSKDKLRQYMKNPLANEKTIRALSKYLYRMSQPYRRLIWYNAEMVDLNMRSVIPNYSITEENDIEKTKDVYYKTLLQLKKMNLENEILKMLIIAWREDAAYGVCYEDESGFFILPLDGDYCKISSINYDSTFNFSFDFSFFRQNKALLEYYGEPFTSMYSAFEKDPNLRWQEIDPSITFCIKVNCEDPTLSMPPYIAMFNSIIDLCDLAEIQSVKDELSIYKLLVARLEVMKNSDTPDDFEVDIATAIEYYNKLEATLPPEVAACISPLPIEAVEFSTDSAKDVDQISMATKNLYNSSGGAQMLNSATISGSTAFQAAIEADSRYATSSILPQITKWVNRYLTYIIGDHAYVKYLNVTVHTKGAYKKSLMESATYGLPNRLAINSVDGITELETLSLQFLEVDVLGLDKKLVPVASSHTQSSDSASGGQTKDADELTDDGDASRDKANKAN